MFYFLYKTTNRVNQRVFYGVHRSWDLGFGTNVSNDPHIGDSVELKADLKQYGRAAFVVQSLHAFADETEAYKALAKQLQATPSTYTSRPNREGNNNTFYGKKHSDDTLNTLSEYRKQVQWINDTTTERQVSKNASIPDGWSRGRLKRPR
jgi:hypothetical protein